MSLIAILDIVFVLASLSFLLLKSLEAEFFWTSVCDSFNWRRNNCQVLNVQSVNCHRHQRGQPSLPKFPGMFTCRYIFMGSAHFSQFPPTASCIKKFWANLHCSQKWPMLASTPDSFMLTVTSKYILFHISGGCTWSCRHFVLQRKRVRRFFPRKKKTERTAAKN